LTASIAWLYVSKRVFFMHNTDFFVAQDFYRSVFY